MPTFPRHTSYTICELLLSWNTSLRSSSAGVSCGEGWKTAAILQNQDFCLMYSYVTVGMMAVCRLAVVGSAGMYHARKPNQTTDKVWQKGRVFFPPLPDIQVQGTEDDTQQFQMGFTLHFSISHTKMLKWNLWYMRTKKPMQAMFVWHLQNKPVLLLPAADAHCFAAEPLRTCSRVAPPRCTLYSGAFLKRSDV